MALSDHVSLTISAGTVSVGRAGFGIPLILSVNAAWSERVRTYTDIEGVAEDFATTAPEYLAANALFSQEPRPETIKIGRAAGKPTQVYTISLPTITLGATYEINVVGQGITAATASYTTAADLAYTAVDVGDVFTAAGHGFTTGDGPFRLAAGGPTGTAADTNYWIIKLTVDTFQLATTKADAIAETELTISSAGSGTLYRNQNDTIIAQLVQDLNAVTGLNYLAVHTAGALETDTIVVTATTAGNWFSLEASNLTLIKIDQTHAEPGTTVATDLAAIIAEDDSWYALYTLYNSDAYVKAAAAAIESRKKIYIADLNNSESATLADGGSDTGDDLQTLNYDRTATMFHPNPSAMAGAAWMGTRLPYEPGSATWKFAQPDIAAVSLTSTQATNLVAKNINFVQTVAGIDIAREGKMVGGEFIDVIRDLDWLEDDMTAAVFETLASNPKVPYTNAGIALIEAAVHGSLLRAAARGIIDSDFTVVVPLVSATSSADRAIRLLSGVKFQCRLAGAIHKVTINGVVTV
jgi:hypothetical protein